MKHGVLAILMIAMCAVAAAAPLEFPLRSSSTEDGREIGWYVSDSQFMKTPEWKFDGRTDPPLAMPDAYSRAYAWLQNTFPKMSSFRLHSYELSTAGSSRVQNRWYYMFDFFGDMDGSTVSNSKFSVMVLMDGTVVEPREGK